MGQAMKQIFDGMDVYDWDGEKVGKITRYDATLGYLQTEGTFSGARYIPVSAIERIGPAGAYLNVPKKLVKDLYQHMPKVRPDTDRTGRLTGNATVASGYTGRPVPLDAEGIELVREKISRGTKVFDAEGRKIGSVEAYDKESGYMRIEKGELFTKELFLPVTIVSYLDDQGVHLAELKDSILSHFVRMPEVAKEFFVH